MAKMSKVCRGWSSLSNDAFAAMLIHPDASMMNGKSFGVADTKPNVASEPYPMLSPAAALKQTSPGAAVPSLMVT